MCSLAASSRQLGLSASARYTKPPQSGGRRCPHALYSRRVTHASAAVDERGSSGGRHTAADAAGNIVPAPLLSQAAPLASAAAGTAAVNASVERGPSGQPVIATIDAAAPAPAAAAASAAAHSAADDFCGEEGLEEEHFEHGVGWRSLDDIAAVHVQEMFEQQFGQEMVNLNENLNQVRRTAAGIHGSSLPRV